MYVRILPYNAYLSIFKLNTSVMTLIDFTQDYTIPLTKLKNGLFAENIIMPNILNINLFPQNKLLIADFA